VRTGAPVVVAAFCLSWGLAACGDIPQPFRHDGAVPDLARPHLVRAVAVRPVQGLADDTATAAAMVKALSDREVPALVHEGLAGSATLDSRFDPASGEMEWTLTNPDAPQPMVLRQAWPRTASPATLAGLTARAAARLTAETPDAPPPAPAVAGRRPKVRLVVPTTLPGDGNTALPRALRGVLERNGILVVGEDSDYIVELKATVTAGPIGQDIVSASWTVALVNGVALGTINQQGPAPKDKLNGAWGGLARDIAEGGALGVMQVVEAHSRAALQNR
jgi:hypothetical protein